MSFNPAVSLKNSKKICPNVKSSAKTFTLLPLPKNQILFNATINSSICCDVVAGPNEILANFRASLAV